MDILDHLLEHDAEATRHQIALCRSLTDEQWHKMFGFGQKSLYSTFDHLLDSKEYWTSLMLGEPGPFFPVPSDPARAQESIERRFEAISDTFITVSRQIRNEGRLNDTFVDIETGPARRTYGACIVHVATHSMHHRAQVLIMLDFLGMEYDPFAGFALDGYALD